MVNDELTNVKTSPKGSRVATPNPGMIKKWAEICGYKPDSVKCTCANDDALNSGDILD